MRFVVLYISLIIKSWWLVLRRQAKDFAERHDMSFRAANESTGGFSGLFHEAGQGLIRIAGGW
jgi:hypothetical protein